MSTNGARIAAKKAEQATSVEEKLGHLAKAIYALANALDDIEHAIKALR